MTDYAFGAFNISKRATDSMADAIRNMEISVKRIRLFAIFLFGIFISGGCNETDDDFIIDYLEEYYPLEIGRYVVYDVDSILFDDFNQRSDTFHYQRKHVVDSAFTDNSGNINYKLIRYQRADSAQPWHLTDVWFVARTSTGLEVVEENARYVKLLFPPSEGQTWEGNKYISIVAENNYLENWIYEVIAMDIPETINGLLFEATLTVAQHDEENLIEKIYAEEKYAKGAGLVYKKLLWLKKQNVSATWSQPEWGFILTMTVNDYGPR